jgi:transcriptional regulator with XRE-family HTH domain
MMNPYMKNPPENLPHFLRAWRKHSKLTLEHVANIIGVKTNTLSDKELGKRPVDTEELRKLAEIYQCEPWMLLAAPPDSGRLEQLVKTAKLLDALTDDQREAWIIIGTTLLPKKGV